MIKKLQMITVMSCVCHQVHPEANFVVLIRYMRAEYKIHVYSFIVVCISWQRTGCVVYDALMSSTTANTGVKEIKYYVRGLLHLRVLQAKTKPSHILRTPSCSFVLYHRVRICNRVWHHMTSLYHQIGVSNIMRIQSVARWQHCTCICAIYCHGPPIEMKKIHAYCKDSLLCGCAHNKR